MIQQTPFVRRQVRKLLLFICGSKEKYRQLRDLHTLDSHVRGIKKLLEEHGIFLRGGVVTASSGSALQYDTLINLVSREHEYKSRSLLPSDLVCNKTPRCRWSTSNPALKSHPRGPSTGRSSASKMTVSCSGVGLVDRGRWLVWARGANLRKDKHKRSSLMAESFLTN